MELGLLASDGTAAGTASLGDSFGASNGVLFQGLYYYGRDPQGEEAPGLWRTDGTAAGTTAVDLGLEEMGGTSAVPYRLGDSLIVRLDFMRPPTSPPSTASIRKPSPPRARSPSGRSPS